MQPDTLLITAFNGFLMAGLTGLMWTRFNRFDDRFDRNDDRFDRQDDDRFDQMAQQIAQCATKTDVSYLRSEVVELREQIGQCATKADVSEVRSEVVELRGEVNSLRSDLTHIALAVGARQPRSAEG